MPLVNFQRSQSKYIQEFSQYSRCFYGGLDFWKSFLHHSRSQPLRCWPFLSVSFSLYQVFSMSNYYPIQKKIYMKAKYGVYTCSHIDAGAYINLSVTRICSSAWGRDRSALCFRKICPPGPPGGPMTKTLYPSAGGPGSSSGQGTKSHMPQQRSKILHATPKTWQPNK